jgi:peptidoglycan/LPS O-acetylase OafA/YrhL
LGGWRGGRDRRRGNEGGRFQRKPKLTVSKLNNFSSLRLVFAAAVIFSHSPFILTGNVSLEPHLGSATIGALAVDGFFLVSGYLITKSFGQDSEY